MPPLGVLALDAPDAPVIKPCNQTLRFKLTALPAQTVGACNSMSLVYINQQNTPVVKPLTDAKPSSDKTPACEAEFPYEQYEMNGLTLAAVTPSAGPFANADAVAAVANYGPALIEVN